MYYDYHVHSTFSPDSTTPMKNTIEWAINHGVKELCFTDHMDFDYEVPDMLFEFNPKEYLSIIDKFSQMYSDKISIKKGIEIGIQPHVIDKCSQLINSNSFDFVISSLHMCNKKDLYTGDFYMNKTPSEALTAYLEELLLCSKTFKDFNVIGHLNLISRYNEEVKALNLLQNKDILEDLFKHLANTNKGIEINTSSFRYSGVLLLTKEVLEFYKECGGKIITTGSDSHVPETIAQDFNTIYDLLKDIGFKYITRFDKMEPKFIKL